MLTQYARFSFRNGAPNPLGLAQVPTQQPDGTDPTTRRAPTQQPVTHSQEMHDRQAATRKEDVARMSCFRWLRSLSRHRSILQVQEAVFFFFPDSASNRPRHPWTQRRVRVHRPMLADHGSRERVQRDRQVLLPPRDQPHGPKSGTLQRLLPHQRQLCLVRSGENPVPEQGDLLRPQLVATGLQPTTRPGRPWASRPCFSTAAST